MRSRFRLELDVVLDTGAVPDVIEAARRQYSNGVASTVEEPEGFRALSAEDFIREIEDALMELAQRNPLLANANVEVDRVACRAAETSPESGPGTGSWSESSAAEGAGDSEDPLDLDKQEGDLEVFETGFYLCRWPNGEFSLVKADTRKDAVVQLDEWAGAEPAWLAPMETCMVDFRLNDRGAIELAEFGEETGESIWEKCYPELSRVLSGDDVSEHLGGKRNRKAANRLRRAVEHERKRLWNVQGVPTAVKTALGRDLQECLGTVGPVADRYVEAVANEILLTKNGEKGKPN
ncbi:MAG: hypothetical protein KJZ84_24530 [Bryobacteraceae bacterium]|nr:hypothetical protein [Bryobacteraceae bacterium]